jgi:hypothetical protein
LTLRVGVWVAAAGVIWPVAGFAQDGSGAAQLLFEQGRDLLRAGNVAEACPKLAESQRLDPANGTLLALAMCHEAEGKLASAWAEYTGVAGLAKHDGQVERAAWSKERAEALRPRLSMLELQVPESVRRLPNLQVYRDGVQMLSGGWNVPVPVDGGEYRIAVSANGYQSWECVVTVATEGDVKVQPVPALEPLPEPATPPSPASRVELAPVGNPATSSDVGWTTLEWVGASSFGLGVVGWLAGGGAIYTALSTYAEADSCEGTCRESLQQDAVGYGNLATGLGLAGTALVIAGGAMYLLGGEETEQTSVTLGIDANGHGGGLVLGGRF